MTSDEVIHRFVTTRRFVPFFCKAVAKFAGKWQLVGFQFETTAQRGEFIVELKWDKSKTPYCSVGSNYTYGYNQKSRMSIKLYKLYNPEGMKKIRMYHSFGLMDYIRLAAFYLSARKFEVVDATKTQSKGGAVA